MILILSTNTKYGMKSDNFQYFILTIHPVYIGDYKRRKKETRDIKKKLTEPLNLRDSEIILIFYLQLNKYKPGFANRVADAFSRLPSQSTLLSLSIPHELHLAKLDKEREIDPLLSQIKQALPLGRPTKQGYSLIQG